MKNKYLSIICLSLLSACANAEHIIGGAIGYGGQAFHLPQEANDGDVFTFDAYYRYMFNPYIGAEVGITTSFGGVGSYLVGQLSEVGDASFSGVSSSLFLQYEILNNTLAYTKLGINHYALDYTLNNVSKEASDMGLGGSLGLEYRFDFGLGMNIEYRHISHSLVDVNELMIGSSYQF